MAMTTSPSRISVANCSENTSSNDKSFASALIKALLSARLRARNRVKRGLVDVDGALAQVARQVGRGGGAAAVADDQDLPVLRPGPLQGVDD